MTFTEAELRREAARSGFRPEVLEKVLRLLELLDALRSHPFLGPRLALKGGTALNLFLFDVPRLSVDIDVNYVGGSSRDAMLQERPLLERALRAVCGRLGMSVCRAPSEHAGGKWRLSYTAVSGASGTLELDVNFMFRRPLWPTVRMSSRPLGGFEASNVPVLDLHELAAGKLAALFGRTASRDLFDVRDLLVRGGLDRRRLRLGFVVYGGINRRDWRRVSLDDVHADPVEVERMLLPVLRRDTAPPKRETGAWTKRLVSECRDLLCAVLPLEPQEYEFLERLNGHGEIAPELLTDDERLQAVLREHPGLRWKAMNVRKHLGLPEADSP